MTLYVIRTTILYKKQLPQVEQFQYMKVRRRKKKERSTTCFCLDHKLNVILSFCCTLSCQLSGTHRRKLQSKTFSDTSSSYAFLLFNSFPIHYSSSFIYFFHRQTSLTNIHTVAFTAHYGISTGDYIYSDQVHT